MPQRKRARSEWPGRLALALLTIPIATCGGSSPGNGGGDSGVGDAGAGLPPVTISSEPVLGAPGRSFRLFGLTSDDLILYQDSADEGLHAMPAAGGAPTKITALDPALAWSVRADGAIVFVWGSSSGGIGPLSLWSRASGLHALSGSSTGLAVADATGSHVAFSGNAMSSPQGALTVDLNLANGDASGSAIVVGGTQLTGDAPIAFAGSRLVALHLESMAPSATLTRFDGNTKVDLASDVTAWQIDPTGTTLLVLSGAATLSAVSIEGGPARTMDHSVQLPIFAPTFSLSADGASVLYATTDTGLKLQRLSSPATTDLAPALLRGVRAASPDGRFIAFFQDGDPQTGTDLWVAPASAPGAASAVLAEATSAGQGALFTVDSSHLLYMSNAAPASGTGELRVAGVPPAGAGTSLGVEVWSFLPVSGSKVVFSANCDDCTADGGHADLEFVETATGAAPSLIRAGADTAFFATRDRSRVIYSVSAGPGAGIYSAVMP